VKAAQLQSARLILWAAGDRVMPPGYGSAWPNSFPRHVWPRSTTATPCFPSTGQPRSPS